VRRGAGLLLAATLLTAGRLRAQQAQDTTRSSPPRITITLRRSGDSLVAPLVRGERLMADGAFEGALRNGFPIRFDFHLALWRNTALFDRLVREASWDAVVILDPVANSYQLVRSTGSSESFSDLRHLEDALSTPFTVDLMPRRPAPGDRFYYIATLTIESLSLSELAEVERWLTGDLGRAITKTGDVGNAFSRGARLALIRLSGLPRRTLETRTETFRP